MANQRHEELAWHLDEGEKCAGSGVLSGPGESHPIGRRVGPLL